MTQKQKFFLNVNVFLLLFSFIACQKETKHRSPLSIPIVINAAQDCTPTEGCSFTFVFVPSKMKEFLKVIGLGSDPILGGTTPELTIDTITTLNGTPTLLQTATGSVNSTSFAANSPLPCTIISGNRATCTSFAPLTDTFTISGTLNNNGVSSPINNLTITMDNSGIIKSNTTMPCGRYGFDPNTGVAVNPGFYTTEQRMYDCSLRVKNFAGIGNGKGGFTPFVPLSPNPNWFLVSCYDTVTEHCSWLTPVIPPSSNATGANEFTSTYALNSFPFRQVGVLLSTYAQTPSSSARFLWSGLLSTDGNTPTSTFNFFEANGRNPWNVLVSETSAGEYDFYQFRGATVVAYGNNSNVKAQACAPSTNNTCDQGGLTIEELDAYYDGVPGSTATILNICTRQTGTDSALIPVTSVYNWQMPSYPMVLMITGGNNGYCEAGAGFTANQAAFCLSYKNNTPSSSSYLGFRATDGIPAFHTNFWSSSVNKISSGWFFDVDGSAGFDRNQVVSSLSSSLGVRCVSTTW